MLLGQNVDMHQQQETPGAGRGRPFLEVLTTIGALLMGSLECAERFTISKLLLCLSHLRGREFAGGGVPYTTDKRRRLTIPILNALQQAISQEAR
jgi:hypothetical protein